MIIKAINVDGHNIVMSADVKQETEKGNNVPAFFSTTRQNMYYGYVIAMGQNILTSKGCCPSVDRSGNGEEGLKSN